MNLRSDNESGVAPEILSALQDANAGSAHAYGDDGISQSLTARFSELFEKDVFVLPVSTGTAANSISISQMSPAYGSVYCYERAHLYVDECGAPEFFSGGAKLLPLPGVDARISAEVLAARIADSGHHGDHESKLCGVSLSQATELGTVYSRDELSTISDVAHAAGLFVHLDGARIANAIVSQNCSPADATWRSGVDFLSFGATKNGAMAAEAVVVFDPANAEGIGRRRKQAGHLISKMRYLSAQLEAYLQDDLWHRLASNANQCTQYLAAGLTELDGVQIMHPVQVNELFVRLPENLSEGLRAKGHEFHFWPGSTDVFRMICAHNTTQEEIENFLKDAEALQTS